MIDNKICQVFTELKLYIFLNVYYSVQPGDDLPFTVLAEKSLEVLQKDA